jgi:molecular chaperone GrpE (heat shock protein)
MEMRLFTRLADAWCALLGKPSTEAQAMHEELVAIKRELAVIRLDLHDANEALALCRTRIEENGVDAAHRITDPLEDLFTDLAPPLSQLRMQAALLESGRDISAGSVMALARQLAEAVEMAGLEPIAAFGKEVSFDPHTCEPLAADLSFSPGETVVVRFIGYRYRGHIIRKALVERLN